MPVKAKFIATRPIPSSVTQLDTINVGNLLVEQLDREFMKMGFLSAVDSYAVIRPNFNTTPHWKVKHASIIVAINDEEVATFLTLAGWERIPLHE